ncbi:MAG TPA: GNAT family N-acetyltransferase [Candidatus Limnocylindrales bacterium]
MTEAEYGTLSQVVLDTFATQFLEAGHAGDFETARAEALTQVRQILPDGVNTDSMLLLVAEAEALTQVGQIWLSLPGTPVHPDTAWVYNVEVSPEHRGKGYGRAIMLAAEEELRRRGVRKLGLNVFGSNKTAIALYDSLGYQVASQQMSKPLI